jgi:hypothetical protein
MVDATRQHTKECTTDVVPSATIPDMDVCGSSAPISGPEYVLRGVRARVIDKMVKTIHKYTDS